MAGAVMESAIENSDDGNPKRASFAAKFRKVKESCPVQVNDYTTLEWVKMKGLNRVEYRYTVSESGRSIVNLNNWLQMDAEVIQRTAESPLAESVVALDLGVDHIFKDTDGKQVYSKAVTKKELKQAKKLAELDEKRKIAEAKMAEAMKTQLAAAGKGLTISTLDTNTRVTNAQIANPVFLSGGSMAPVKATDSAAPAEAWSPSKVERTPNMPANPAGVKANPFGAPTTQSNPYAN